MSIATVTRSRYDEATVERICERLRAGESLLRISKDPDMPSQRTLSDWVAKNRFGFAERYLEAKRVAAHFLAEQAMEEACNAASDFNLNDEGRPVFDGHHVQRSKLIVETIKWQVGKMLPRLYGDRISQEPDATGDLAELLKAASNRDTGLPPPIDAEYEQLPEDDSLAEAELVPERSDTENSETQDHRPAGHLLHGISSASSTPSNHRKNFSRR